MSASLRKSASHTAVYGVGIVLQNATSLVMLPIYTRYLTPSDYGALELLQMVLDLAAILFGTRLVGGMYRYYFAEADETRRNAVVSSALILIVALQAVAAALCMAMAEPISLVVLGSRELETDVALFSAALITSPLVWVPLGYLRAREKPWAFVLISAFRLALQVSLNLYFLVVLEFGMRGVILSTLISQIVVGGALTVWCLKEVGTAVRRDDILRLTRFALPITGASLGAFYTTFGDRFFLQHYHGLAAVGLYALAYKFGFILATIVWGPFASMWEAQKFVAVRDGQPKTFFQRLFLLLMLALITAALAMSLLAPEMLRILSGPEFWPAASIVPVILAAYVLKPAIDFCSLGSLVSDRTSNILHASLLSVAVMSVGYITLIPRYGGLGAALATAAGMAAELWWVHRTSARLFDMHLPWMRVAAVGVAAVVVFSIGSLLPPLPIYASASAKVALILLFVVVLFFSPVVPRTDRTRAAALLLTGIKRATARQPS